MKTLSADNLDKIKYKTKKVTLVKAVDTSINVALLAGSLLDEGKDLSDEDFSFLLLKKGVLDDQGKPVFETKKAFKNLAVGLQAEILDAVYEYNGMSRTAVEDAAKN